MFGLFKPKEESEFTKAEQLVIDRAEELYLQFMKEVQQLDSMRIYVNVEYKDGNFARNVFSYAGGDGATHFLNMQQKTPYRLTFSKSPMRKGFDGKGLQ